MHSDSTIQAAVVQVILLFLEQGVLSTEGERNSSLGQGIRTTRIDKRYTFEASMALGCGLPSHRPAAITQLSSLAMGV